MLTQLCVASTSTLLHIANIAPQVVLASSLPVGGKSSRLMASICEYLGAGTYLSDSGGRNYLQLEHFNGIDVAWQDWQEPAALWPGLSTWRNVSSVNYLARAGAEALTSHLLAAAFEVSRAPRPSAVVDLSSPP
jgi:hypothetical protein